MRQKNPIAAGHQILGVLEAPNRKFFVWWQPGSEPTSGLTFDGTTTFASVGAAKIALRSSYVSSHHSFDPKKKVQFYKSGRAYLTCGCECGCGLTMKQENGSVKFYERAELIEE